MALADLGNLFRADEHTLHFGCLIGAAHPSLDAQVRASARARTRQRCGEVADRKPDPGAIGIERGNDDLADIALRDGIAGARPDDLEDQILVHHEAVARLRFISDQAEIGGAERLIGLDAMRFDLLLQRRRKRPRRKLPRA